MRMLLICHVCLSSTLVIAQWSGNAVSRAGQSGAADTVSLSSSGNVAASALRSSSHVAVSYLPGLFGLAELRRTAISVSLTSAPWGWDVHIQRYGASLFQETQILAGVSRRLSSASAFGIRAGLSWWKPANYEATIGWIVHSGILFRERRYSGGCTLSAKYDLHGLLLLEVVAGSSARIAEHLSVSAEIRQEHGYRPEMSYSIMWRPLSSFGAVVGWKESPRVFGAGCVVGLERVEVVYGANRHAVLGWTQAATIAVMY